MKKIFYILLIGTITFSCTIDDQVNPNAPSLDEIVGSASKTDLNNLVTGVLAQMRVSHSNYITATGTVTRELYLFDADPRNTTDLIGTKGTLSNSVFYTGANWTSRYRTIKNCNIVLDALENALPEVTEAEKEGYRGFVKTIMAHQFIILYSQYDKSGIRLDVADPFDFGPLVTTPATVLTFISDLLDEANDHLTGASFAMSMGNGFDGFDDVASFSEFNRALAARAAIYANNKADALTYLGDSFMDLAGDFGTGPKMIFSNNGGDILNDLFKTPGQNGNQIVFSDSWINEAEAGDTRVTTKAALRNDPSTKSGISAAYETRLYATSTSPIDIIRNEELILIYAEANIGSGGNVTAISAIDVIRTAYGLDPYAGATDDASVLEEVLNQRRYSLWAEGHRMVDLRRTGNLNSTYITLDNIVVDGDPVTQVIFTEFPLPQTEIGF